MNRLATFVLLVMLTSVCGVALGAPHGSGSGAPVAPVKKQALTKDEARTEAARLANAAIEARPDLRYPDGTKVKGDLKPEHFTGSFAKGRWTLEHMPPAGTFATVSFDQFGEHAKLEVGHADE